MTKKQKNLLVRVIAAGVLMLALALLPIKHPVVRFALFLIPYLTVGYDILRKAFKGILNRQVFDEHFLMDDDPMKIAKAIRIAKKCIRIVYQNIYFAIIVKLACLLLGALGIANMWLAIFADVGVMVLCVLNAIRCLAVKNL